MIRRELKYELMDVAVMVAAMLVLLYVSGCTATMGMNNVKPLSEMTPKEKSSFFMSVYNKEYDNYLDVYTSPSGLSEEQKTVLRKKKAILTEVYPYIEKYSDYVAAGVTPDKAKEEIIIRLLDEVGNMK